MHQLKIAYLVFMMFFFTKFQPNWIDKERVILIQFNQIDILKILHNLFFENLKTLTLFQTVGTKLYYTQ